MDANTIRLLDVPDNCRTERLVLRVVRPGDGETITQAKADSMERLQPWFPWAQEVGSVEENESWARGVYAEYWNRTSVGFEIRLPENDELIGMIGIHNRKIDPLFWELGYWLRTGHEGKGYMTEAAKACTGFAFEYLKAEKVIIRADSRNTPSQKVAERCGYHFDGTLRWYEKDAMDPEKRIDMCFYSLIRPEYEANRDFYKVLQ